MKTLEPKPCGTRAAYKRGCRCEPCKQDQRNYDAERRKAQGITPRIPEHEIINEIEFLLMCGEGEHAITRALNTTPQALQRRLHRAKRHDLIPRIFEPTEQATP